MQKRILYPADSPICGRERRLAVKMRKSLIFDLSKKDQ